MMAPNKKTSGPKGPVEEKRTVAAEGDAAAKLETAIRANGADVAKSIALINTGRAEAEYFAFVRPHRAPIFGFGSKHAAHEYARLLSQQAVDFTYRRLTAAEAAQIQHCGTFVINDELLKINPTRKAI
jgi:hypothetical protein